MGARIGFSFEDPMVEAAVLWGRGSPRAALPAGGGDVALALQALFPGGSFVLYDPDEDRLAFAREKAAAAPDEALALCQTGEAEAIWRVFRAFVRELVAPEEVVKAALSGDSQAYGRITSHPAWPLAFEGALSDAVIGAVFGEGSRGPSGGWAGWIRAALEAGLAAPDASRNPWLHHVLLGAFPEGALPPWRALPPAPEHRFSYLRGGPGDVPDLDLCDLVVISGLFDGPSEDDLAVAGRVLSAKMRPNAVLLVRSVDPRATPEEAFDGFLFDAEWARSLHDSERGMVWGKVAVGVKR
jgi:S-adenosylmethionine-diacylglycerol 3-amino-3-carboxypropyl transferase